MRSHNATLGVFAALVAALLPLVAAAEPARPPNLVVVVADDVGWVDLDTGTTSQGHGSKYHETPNLARLAADGMSFSAAYALQNSMPSRASLVTGQYPTRHWVYNVGGFMEAPPAVQTKARIATPSGHRNDIFARTLTLPETLATAGYRSAVIGKQHGFGPARALTRSHGFDLNLSIAQRQRVGKEWREYRARRGANGAWQFGRPVYDAYASPYDAEYIAKHLAPFANGNDPSKLAGRPKHLTDAIADMTVAQISRYAAKRQPFFLLVGFHAVHRPVTPRPDLMAKYAARKSDDPRHRRPAYAAMLEGLDQAVGRIVAALDDPNGDGEKTDSVAGETLVVFLSDNGGAYGETSNAPLRGGEGSFLEGGIRVPMIARLPGTIAPGSVSEEPVHVIDLYPTFMELANASRPPKGKHYLDGESLLPLLRGEAKQLQRPALFWHFPGYIDLRMRPSSVINRRHKGRRYKLSWSYENDRYSLYDLSNDLGESVDLLEGETQPEHRKAAERLARELRQWIIGMRAPLGWVKARNQPVKPPPRLDAPKRRKG